MINSLAVERYGIIVHILNEIVCIYFISGAYFFALSIIIFCILFHKSSIFLAVREGNKNASSHQLLCMALAKCDAIASGNFLNLRWFQPEHFETIDDNFSLTPIIIVQLFPTLKHVNFLFQHRFPEHYFDIVYEDNKDNA